MQIRIADISSERLLRYALETYAMWHETDLPEVN